MALDITADTAKVAVIAAGGEVAESDFVAAEWTRNAPVPGTKSDIHPLSTEYRYAKVTGTVDGASDSAWIRWLMGPSGVVAAPAGSKSVDVYGWVGDSPETIIRKLGTIKMTA